MGLLRKISFVLAAIAAILFICWMQHFRTISNTSATGNVETAALQQPEINAIYKTLDDEELVADPSEIDLGMIKTR